MGAVVGDLQAHAVGRLVEQEGEPGPARHVHHLVHGEAKALGLHDLVDGLHPRLPDPREHQEVDDLPRAPQGLEELGVELDPEQGAGVRQPPPDLCAGGRVDLDPVHEAVGVAANLPRLHLHAVDALGTTGEVDQVGVQLQGQPRPRPADEEPSLAGPDQPSPIAALPHVDKGAADALVRVGERRPGLEEVGAVTRQPQGIEAHVVHVAGVDQLLQRGVGAKELPEVILELRALHGVPERELSAVEGHAGQRGASLGGRRTVLLLWSHAIHVG